MPCVRLRAVHPRGSEQHSTLTVSGDRMRNRVMYQHACDVGRVWGVSIIEDWQRYSQQERCERRTRSHPPVSTYTVPFMPRPILVSQFPTIVEFSSLMHAGFPSFWPRLRDAVSRVSCLHPRPHNHTLPHRCVPKTTRMLVPPDRYARTQHAIIFTVSICTRTSTTLQQRRPPRGAG
jgi:hypothetical protein